MIGDFRRPADRAEIDRVVLADPVLPVVRHHLAVLFVIVPAGEIEMVEMHVEAMLFRRRLQHAKTLWDDFLADAVAGNDRDAIFFSLAHEESLHFAAAAP